jgi:hypothetical protein
MEKYRKKNDILDPFSVIVKLFIYSYKPIGTKISICCNSIAIQEPGIFQGTVRIFMRDSKNDINIIIFPILYACVKYLTGDLKVKYFAIFERVLLSFDILKETYNGNEIVYNIDQLKTIVSSFLNATSPLDPTTLLNTYSSPGGLIKQNMYNHINSIWTQERVSVIFGIILEIMQTSSAELVASLLNALSHYMASIDMMTSNLISAI